MTATLAHFDPFTDFRHSLDRVFDRRVRPLPKNAEHRPSPTVDLNVTETEDAFVIEAAIAGVAPEDVEIQVDDDVLTIRGSFGSRDAEEGERFIRREIRNGEFERSLRLGPAVDADEAKATFDNGLLKLTLPKRADAKPRTIKISNG